MNDNAHPVFKGLLDGIGKGLPMDVFNERCQEIIFGGIHCWKKHPCEDHDEKPKCGTCEGTGKADGTPDSPKCSDCYCAECTFSPCECVKEPRIVTYQDDPHDD